MTTTATVEFDAYSPEVAQDPCPMYESLPVVLVGSEV
jgi:hypothetical protein